MPKRPPYGKRKAVLYATCSMNYNDPDLGWLARQVLAKIGVETEVVYPACCGMPQLEQGLIGDVVANARKVAAAMQAWIAKGYDIVALVPSCALMLKLEWPLAGAAKRSVARGHRRAGQSHIRPYRIRRRHRQKARAGARLDAACRDPSPCTLPAMPARRIWAQRPPKCCGFCRSRRGSR